MPADLNGPSTRSGSRQAFVADLITPGRILIFTAGFLLALLLARLLPSVALFHPQGQIHTKDIVITGLRGQTVADVDGIVTRDGESFGGTTNLAWDGDLLNFAIEQAAQGVPLEIPARIIYVVPPEGVVATILIEPRE